MISRYNLYKIKIAGTKYRTSIARSMMLQDPYRYSMQDVFMAMYSISNVYKIYM